MCVFVLFHPVQICGSERLQICLLPQQGCKKLPNLTVLHACVQYMHHCMQLLLLCVVSVCVVGCLASQVVHS